MQDYQRALNDKPHCSVRPDILALLEDGTGVTQGEHHAWASYDADPTLADKLHIEYTTTRKLNADRS